MQTLTPNFLKLQDECFRFLGFDIVKGNHGWRHPWRILLGVISLMLTQLMVIAFAIQNRQDVDKLADALAAFLLNGLGLLKIVIMLRLTKDFERFVSELRNMLTKECESEIPASIINKENDHVHRIGTLYKNVFLLAGLLSSLKPIFSMMVNFVSTGKLQLELTFPCVYPWNVEELHKALPIYTLLVVASFAVVLPIICLDTFLAALIFNLVAMFKTAQHKMQILEAKTPKETQLQLANVFHLYQRSLDLSVKLNLHFRPFICIQLLVASLHLCVLSYTLSQNFGRPQMPFYVVFTISVLVQLYIYCYCGEYLKSESRAFARAIYDSSWYEAVATSSATGRSFQISMMRAQRGCHIDGYFFEANMEVFLSIVRKAMSYFTLLRSIS